MNFGPAVRVITFSACWLVGIPARCAAQAESPLPDPASVMKNVVRRSEESARLGEADRYSFEKRSVEEEIDTAGKPTKTTEKTYRVFPIHGIPFERLVKIQGRELTDRERREQDRKEAEFRKKAEESQSADATNKESIDQALIDRFVFKVERRENLFRRSTLVVSFLSKGGPEKSIEDKVLNRLAGTLWVDEADSEIAQLKLGLTADLSLGWFGMIGSLKHFDLSIERERLPDGVWVDRKQSLVLVGRKVLAPMRYRTTDESSNFEKEAE